MDGGGGGEGGGRRTNRFQKKVTTDTIRKDKQQRRVYRNIGLFSDLQVKGTDTAEKGEGCR